MNWLEAQMALIDAATLVAQFAVNWLVQSTLLIAAGLTIARLLRRRGSAVQSVVYRTTLATVLVCPLATWTLSQTGVSGWSVKLPAGWTYHEIESAPIVIDVSDSASGPIAAQPSTAPPASLETPPAPFPLDNDPAMPLDSASMPPPGIAAHAAEQAESPRVVAESPPELSTAAAPTMTRIFSVQRIGWAALGMTAGWLFLSGLLGTRLAVAWRRLARLRRGSLPAEPEIRSDCHDLAALLNVSPPVVLRSAFLPSPCLVGLRRPAVMLPDGELSLPLRDTLIHELAHLKRHDCHWNLLRQAAVAAFFFQPLLWRLSRRIEQAAEEVCDDYVIHYGSDRQEYAHCLVDVAELSSAPIAAAGVGIVSLRSMLARRVTRILDTSRTLSTRAGNLLLAAVLIGGVTGTTIVGLVGLGPQSSRGETESTATANNAPPHDQDGTNSSGAEVTDDDDLVTVRGDVVDPDGKPVVGATVRLPDDMSTRVQTALTDKDGRFEIVFDKTKFTEPARRPQPWGRAYLYATAQGYATSWITGNELAGDPSPTLRLKRDDVPVRGQILSLEGEPVPHAKLEVWDIYEPHNGSLDGLLETVRDRPNRVQSYFNREMRYFPGRLLQLQLQRGTLKSSDEGKPVIVTDEQGRFELGGIGRERLVRIGLDGADIVSTKVQVVTRTTVGSVQKLIPTIGDEARRMVDSGGALPHVYAATFQHFAGPSFPITGVVRDRDTGEPIPGIGVAGWLRNTDNHAQAMTDENGRYELRGIGVEGTFQQLNAGPRDSAILPYIGAEKPKISFSAASPLTKDDTDFELTRGVVVRGRVTEANSKQPVKARIEYLASGDNPHVQKLAHGIWSYTYAYTDENGKFAIAVLPGPGALAVWTRLSSDVPDRYRPAGAEQYGLPISEQGWFSTANRGLIRPADYKAARFIDFGADEGPHEIALTVTPVMDVTRVRCEDQDGRPMRDVYVAGHLPWDDNFKRIPHGGLEVGRGAETYIEVADLGAETRRAVVFRHGDKNLAALLFPSHSDLSPRLADLDRDDDGAYRLTLTPSGSLTGQLVDATGDPVTQAGVELHLLTGADHRETGIEIAESEVDEQGRFHLRKVPAGGPYLLGGGGQSFPGGLLKRDLYLDAGQTTDLGAIDLSSATQREPMRTKSPTESLGTSVRASDHGVSDDRSYSGHVTDTDGHPVRDARIWMVAWKRSDDMRETLYELYQDRYELGRTDDQGNFTVRWNAQVWGESAAEIMASRPMLAAHAPDHGLDWLPLEVFDDHPVASSKREELEVKIDKAFGAGRFAGRTLKLPPQQPIRGRLVDLEGRPLSDVTVRVEALKRPDMRILTQAFERSSKDLVYQAISATAPVDGFHRTVLHKFVPPLTTDGEGRFELTGIGRDQLAMLSFHGDGLQSQQIHALGRAMDVVQLPHIQHYPNGSKDVYVGRDFTFALGPSIPVSGVVKDFDTGMPVPETVVFVDRLFSEGGGAAEGQLRLDTKHMRAMTDEEGRFRITGMPPGNGHELIAIPPKTEPYLMAKKAVSPRAEDSETTVEMQVKKGIWIQGRLTDKQSGEPIHGTVDYLALRKNPFSLDKLGLRQGWEILRYWTDRSGHYRVVGLPGPGVLLARNAFGKKVYPRAVGAETVDGYRADNRTIPTTPTGLPISNWHLIKQIDPAEDAESFSCDLVLEAGPSIPGRVIGPDGDPVLQLYVLGEVLNDGFWQLRANGKFDVKNYDGQGPRQLFFKSGDETLVGQYRLEGDAPHEITVRLQPAIRVTGQLIESETGLPAQGYELYCEKSSSGYFRIADVLTDDSGRFEIKGLLSGAVYEMGSANPQHFSSGRNNFTVDLRNAKPGDVVEVGTVPRQVTNKGAMVAGRVLLADGEPASGAHVAVIAWRIETKRRGDLSSHTGILAESVTDEDGLYRLNLEKVSNKTHRDANLVARKDGTAVAWKQLDLDKTQTEVDLKLPPEEPVSVRLVDIEGQPAAGVKVPVQMVKKRTTNGVWGWSREAVGFPAGMPAPAAWLPAATTDEQGRCTLRGVPAGHGVYLKVAGNDRFAPQGISLNTGMPEQRVGRDRTYRSLVKNVDAGEEAVLPLAPAQVFEGAVSYEDTGQPAPNARMTIWASQVGISSMVSVEGRADSEGKYRITPRPGTRFGITAYSPDGTAYLVRTTPHLEAIQWKTGDRVRRVDISLPRGVLVRGRIVEEGSGRAVAGASIQYVPESENNPHTADDIITGWQGFELSDKQGSFSIAVLPGPGRLLVHGPDGRYVLQEIGDRQLSSGKPGGMRNYAHAIAKIHPDENAPPIDITIPLKPGATASGRMVDEQGELAEEVLVISRLHIRPHNLDWCGQIPPTLGGRFELAGLQPGQQYPVSFLDAKRRLGATVTIQADDKDPTVVLKPCGQASARFLDPEGQPHVGFRPGLYMIVTPGADREDFEAARRGELNADADFVANIDQVNHWPMPPTDQHGRVTFPALIPGTTYLLVYSKPKFRKEFTIEPGQHLELGDITVDVEVPKSDAP